MAVRKIEIGWTGKTVMYNLPRYRGLRRMTLTDVADKLEELGRPMSVPTLSGIENGRRRIDVDDLVYLALALDVSPAALMMPPADDPDTDMAGAPCPDDYPTPEAVDWWSWLTSCHPLWSGPNTTDFEVQRWRYDINPAFTKGGLPDG